MEKIKIEFHQTVEPKRKNSFWFDGHVATVSDGRISVFIVARGELSGHLDANADVLQRKEFVTEAKKRGYTDKKIDVLGQNDFFNCCNWFNLEVDKGDNFEDLEKTINNLKDAIDKAKAYIKDKAKAYIKDKAKAYIKERIKLQDFFEKEDFQVHLFTQDEMQCAEVEKWTNGGVDMIVTMMPFDKNQFIEYVNDFNVDDEIDTHRQDKLYKHNFSISESLKDFTDFHDMLKGVVEKLKNKK